VHTDNTKEVFAYVMPNVEKPGGNFRAFNNTVAALPDDEAGALAEQISLAASGEKEASWPRMRGSWFGSDLLSGFDHFRQVEAGGGAPVQVFLD